ncbi:MAG: phosphate ABC transporter permease PstA [Verrucomicrobiales bacterium]|nr:phosphate ABC transporter permease PstA [Verrucomicrobiales bacterium]
MKSLIHRQRKPADAFAAVILWVMAMAVSFVFVWIVFSIVAGGLSSISREFLTKPPEFSGRSGGISTVLVSTAVILMICLGAAVPLGIATALFLSEFTGNDEWFGRLVRRSLDVLAGVPSIVFGLFGSVFFCRVLGMGYSLIAGGLTLACMVLPIFIRSAEAGLRAVPEEYRSTAAALGISRRAVIFRLILPAAVPGLISGLILSLGRAAAETAALLYTSGYVDRMPESVFDSGRSLTVHIYDLAMNVPGGNSHAYGSALVLVVLLLIINGAATWIGEHGLRRRLIRS